MSTAPPPEPTSEARETVVDATKRGARLDRLLVDACPDLSRARIQALIAAGHATVDGKTLRSASYRVKPGEHIVLSLPPATDATPQAQAIDLVIVHEDDDVIVIDKPAGLVVHPAAGNPDRTLVNALLHHCGASLVGVGGVKRPGIVHRLDKDTSGLIVAAKNDRAHHALVEAFASRSIERSYTAVVWGIPTPSEGRIAANIGRSRRNRQKMAIMRSSGRTAVTRYKLLRVLGGAMASLLQCRLETGRTHQIRVHLASIGYPIIGDPLYGRASGQRRAAPDAVQSELGRLGRQALHATTLGFRHPSSGEELRFESPLPADIARLIAGLDRAV
ncbi:MAG: RluA family pseudouridine synthase [Alphaproteobacteria bacterium]|nr:RluA family pseudouridine synthase [Alphaproteobacteria bacterium]